MTMITFGLEGGHSSRYMLKVALPDNSEYMSALFFLVTASIVVAGAFLGAFIWSVRTNQFEDQKGAAMRILHDNEISSKQ